jgi:hypothetical protein
MSDQTFQPRRKNNTLAVLGFAFSIVFAVLSLCVPFLSLISLGLSIGGLVQTSKNPNQGGKGLAIAGIIISGVVLLFLVIGLASIAASNS